MTTRREVLKGMAVGAAVASVPATAAAVHLFRSGGPAPWWLLAPLGRGSNLAFGWYVHDLSPVTKGACVLTLRHINGDSAGVHLCGYDRSPRGIAHTALVDLVLMDGRNANAQTDERLGRLVLGLAKLIANNETNPEGDLVPLAHMLTHSERVELFGPEEIAT